MQTFKFGYPSGSGSDPGRCVIELTHRLEPHFIAQLRPFFEIELLRGTRRVTDELIVYTFHTTDEKIAALRRAFQQVFFQHLPQNSDS